MSKSETVSRDRPFDCVLFDLDGTLVATDRFWVQAARAGARRAFDELGLERELPDRAAWMSLVGLPLDEGFRTLFPELDETVRARVQACCVEEEHRLLDAGGAALMPGAESALDSLRDSGVRMAVASNCSQAYLDHMWSALKLERWMETGRCLDSPGIRDKSDMLAELLTLFDTRSGVMVGDRGTDGAAAAANALPFVFCRFGFAPEGEQIAPGGTIDDFSELEGMLAERTRGIRATLERAGCLRSTFVAPAILGIAGPPGSGATLFGRDAARMLGATFVPLASFAQERSDDALGIDFERLDEWVLGPRSRGESATLRLEEHDAGGVPRVSEAQLDPARLLVLEGPALLDPRLSARLDRLIVVESGDDVALERLAGRDARRYGPGALESARRRQAAWRQLTSRIEPSRVADAVVDLEDVLRPTLG